MATKILHKDLEGHVAQNASRGRPARARVGMVALLKLGRRPNKVFPQKAEQFSGAMSQVDFLFGAHPIATKKFVFPFAQF